MSVVNYNYSIANARHLYNMRYGGFKYDKNYNEGGRGCSGRPKQESSYEDSKCNHILR